LRKEIIMSEQSQATNPSSFFDLHVEGVGYLNRVRTVRPKKGQEFLACSVSAMRGSTEDIAYTKFDCKVSGAEARKVIKLLEPSVTADKAVIVGFRIGDVYPELFTFEKGEKRGQTGMTIKGRLLRIKFAKVNGVAVELPLPERSMSGEVRPA
jgi:hypothetical protein